MQAESICVTGVVQVRTALEGSGRDADPCQRQLLGPFVLANRRGAAPLARLLHRLPSLNGVVPQHPPARLRDRVVRLPPMECPQDDPLGMSR